MPQDELSVVFEGAAGQGIKAMADILAATLKDCGYFVSVSHEYMSRIRGGSNTAQIRITDKPRTAYTRRTDIYIGLSAEALRRYHERSGTGSVAYIEHDAPSDGVPGKIVTTPFSEMAAECGSNRYRNTVGGGIVLGMLALPLKPFITHLEAAFARSGTDAMKGNARAAALGYGWGEAHQDGGMPFSPPVDTDLAVEHLLLTGTQALGIGAVAAGCNFLSSYPMSPATGLMTFLAAHAEAFGIVVDQAEDEIAALNACVGASFAGARALASTSGGGFDLMQEGLSLAAMTETPVVIHVAQRPGPATGLPTRTEQGDLSLVLHGGHGEFPRIVLAPGSISELVTAMQQAFSSSSRYQVPVIILTDQHLLDLATTIPRSVIRRIGSYPSIIQTACGYRRYAFTADGISPRGVPGYGEGIVRADSDEHDESGLITESFEMRRRMMEKRLKRRTAMAKAALPPSAFGDPESAHTLFLAWGSTRSLLEEALEKTGGEGCAGLHFSQVYPLPPDVYRLLQGRRLAVIENNATGQFADLLTREAGVVVSHRILKSSGEPFAVEDICEALREISNA
ncbi:MULTISPECIES: 2-oxoacid:acceptor oxidoreductase subunit alpha [Chlorobium/Pelodictyon group]|uniref:2-oxoacid:ferredoxin oxidoreductase, alpha subunit n=1 Tax=Chlorobium luteolum (strain DSM 273 / BCRC 81028 / 2530) TaxID=319225 RepID=Q3B3Z7_CHLL3|nr:MULTISPECIES: 2-oxoacid:acceptor oxidoreductase subunit alpha [Chlorobium/Pelodictyon group]ABB23934.1 2-oxoacid:ferredoxin oxidoreductase, alpha subunit [Pelodictyon luteolum DSM 273]TCD47410.1 2-oxoacid:acceptor oxidoreductase subunit alpha [Chlorobium sp. N1]